MFTGIVEERGRVIAPGRRLEIETNGVGEDISIGDSISVNGVCLTVVGAGESSLAFDLAEETLARTNLADLREGDPVNLERPVTLLSRLGGHLVQGHVDGVGTVEDSSSNPEGETMTIALPEPLRQYVIEKGSIAVDGVSLTVASVQDGGFSVALIPHTRSSTTLGTLSPGDRVNLEVDVLAKYVESLLGRRS